MLRTKSVASPIDTQADGLRVLATRFRGRGTSTSLFTPRLLRELGGSQPVTVMCQCADDQVHCHRHILKQMIDRA